MPLCHPQLSDERSSDHTVQSNRPVVLAIWVVAALLWSTGAWAAESYPKGHGALQVFDAEGMAVTPTWVKLWVGFLMATFAAGLLFVWRHPIARWTTGGFLVSAGTGALVFSALGLPFLSGSIAIMHIICWMPALLMLILKRPFLNPEEGLGYRIWAGVITFAILFSFIFDFRDAGIYIAHVTGMG